MTRGNEQAFPAPDPNTVNLDGSPVYLPGMSLREYAAIQVAAGFSGSELGGDTAAEVVALQAVSVADALLAELERTKGA